MKKPTTNSTKQTQLTTPKLQHVRGGAKSIRIRAKAKGDSSTEG